MFTCKRVASSPSSDSASSALDPAALELQTLIDQVSSLLAQSKGPFSVFLTVLIHQEGALTSLVSLVENRLPGFVDPKIESICEAVEQLLGVKVPFDKPQAVCFRAQRINESLKIYREIRLLMVIDRPEMQSSYKLSHQKLACLQLLEESLSSGDWTAEQLQTICTRATRKSLVELLHIAGLSSLEDCTVEKLTHHIETLKSGIVKTAISHTYLSLVMGAPTTIEMSEIPFLPDVSKLDEATKDLLFSLFHSLDSNNAEQDFLTQWVGVICGVEGLNVGKEMILSLFTKGCVGQELNNVIRECRKNKSFHKPCLLQLASMIKHCRTQREYELGRSQNLELEEEEREECRKLALRLEMSEGRLGDALIVLRDKVNLAHETSASLPWQDVTVCLARWENDLKDVCSVGQDLQLANLRVEIEMICETSQSSLPSHVQALRSSCLGWAQSKIVQLLQDIGVPAAFWTDVHHVNAVATVICSESDIPVPEALQDPYSAACEEQIFENADLINTEYNRIYELLVNWWSDPHRDPSQNTLRQLFQQVCEAGFCEKTPDTDDLTQQLVYVQICLIKQGVQSLSLTGFGQFLFELGGQSEPQDLSHLFLKIDQQLIEIGYLNGLLEVVFQAEEIDLFKTLWDVLMLDDTTRGMDFVFREDESGRTFLEKSCMCENTLILDFLEQKLLNPSTSLSWRERVCDVLKRNRAEGAPTVLMLAATGGDHTIFNRVCVKLAIWLNSEADYDALWQDQDELGDTVLAKAVISQSEACVRRSLVESGCQGVVNLANADGHTPLHCAVVEGDNSQILEMLVEHGGNLTATTPRRSGLLHLAMMHGRAACASYLVHHVDHLDFLHSDLSDCGPFHYAKTDSLFNAVLDQLLTFHHQPGSERILIWDHAVRSQKIQPRGWAIILDRLTPPEVQRFLIRQISENGLKKDTLRSALTYIRTCEKMTLPLWLELLQTVSILNLDSSTCALILNEVLCSNDIFNSAQNESLAVGEILSFLSKLSPQKLTQTLSHLVQMREVSLGSWMALASSDHDGVSVELSVSLVQSALSSGTLTEYSQCESLLNCLSRRGILSQKLAPVIRIALNTTLFDRHVSLARLATWVIKFVSAHPPLPHKPDPNSTHTGLFSVLQDMICSTPFPVEACFALIHDMISCFGGDGDWRSFFVKAIQSPKINSKDCLWLIKIAKDHKKTRPLLELLLNESVSANKLTREQVDELVSHSGFCTIS